MVDTVMALIESIAVGKEFHYLQLHYQHSGRSSVFHDLLDSIV